MNIRDAKLCPVCEEVFVGKQCPRDGEQGTFISKWVPPSQPRPEIIKELPGA
jgi:hypothetical protein